MIKEPNPNSQKGRILALFRQKLRPITNRSLHKLCLNHTARISELRQAGFNIKAAPTDKYGVTRYTLDEANPYPPQEPVRRESSTQGDSLNTPIKYPHPRHWNGTSLNALLAQQRAIYDACATLLGALSDATPHERDWQSVRQQQQSYSTARLIGMRQRIAVTRIQDDAHATALAINQAVESS